MTFVYNLLLYNNIMINQLKFNMSKPGLKNPFNGRRHFLFGAYDALYFYFLYQDDVKNLKNK